MYSSKLGRKGLQFTGSEELLRRLPIGSLVRLSDTFGYRYQTIHRFVSGKMYTKASIIECAVKLVLAYEGSNIEGIMKDICDTYKSKEPVS